MRTSVKLDWKIPDWNTLISGVRLDRLTGFPFESVAVMVGVPVKLNEAEVSTSIPSPEGERSQWIRPKFVLA